MPYTRSRIVWPKEHIQRGGESEDMPLGSVERRRGRRINLQAPLLIRRIGTHAPESFREETIMNISLAGIYFETEQPDSLTANDVVMTSVSVPETQRREFPFTRLAGRSRVVWIKELPQQEPEGRKRFGIAIEFGNDVTALTSIPPRG